MSKPYDKNNHPSRALSPTQFESPGQYRPNYITQGLNKESSWARPSGSEVISEIRKISREHSVEHVETSQLEQDLGAQEKEQEDEGEEPDEADLDLMRDKDAEEAEEEAERKANASDDDN